MKKGTMRFCVVAATVVMFLSILLCATTMTSFAASESETHFAQIQAKVRWNEAKGYWSDVVYVGGQTISVANGNTTGKLSDLTYVTGANADSTYAFKDGVLTLSGSGETITITGMNSNVMGITSDGALWIVYDNISTNGKIRPFMGWSEKYPAHDMPLIVSSPIDEDFNVLAPNGTENVGGMITQTTSANNLIRNSGSLIILGDIGFSAGKNSTSSSGDSIGAINDAVEHVCILAPGRNSSVVCVEKPYKDENGRSIRCGVAGSLYIFGSIFNDDPVSITLPNWINAPAGVVLDDGASLTLSGTNAYIEATTGGLSLKNGSNLFLINTTLETPIGLPENGLAVDETSSIVYGTVVNSVYTYTIPTAGVYKINDTAFSVRAGEKVSSSTALSFSKLSSDAESSTLPNLPEWYGEIYTKDDLNNVRDHLNGYYVLKNDIAFTNADFSKGGAFYNNGVGWKPIGTDRNSAFTGTFDGNGYAIKNLRINIEDEYAGLFGYVNGGSIQNLGLVDFNIAVFSTYYVYSGGILGYSEGSTVLNCYNRGNLVLSDLFGDGMITLTDVSEGNITLDAVATAVTLDRVVASRIQFDILLDYSVTLIGENRLGSEAENLLNVFVVSGSNVVLSGDGSLTVFANHSAICTSHDLKIAGGTLILPNGSLSYETDSVVSIGEDLIISGGTMKVDASASFKINMIQTKNLYLSGGTLEGNISNNGTVINSTESINITGGTLKITGIGNGVLKSSNIDISQGDGNSTLVDISGYANLIYATGVLNVYGGTVNLSSEKDHCVRVKTVNISGGIVKGATNYGNVIYADDTVSISGGAVDVSTQTHHAIYGVNCVTISGGTVNAFGIPTKVERGVIRSALYQQTGGFVTVIASENSKGNALYGEHIRFSGGVMNATSQVATVVGNSVAILGGSVNTFSHGGSGIVCNNTLTVSGADTIVNICAKMGWAMDAKSLVVSGGAVNTFVLDDTGKEVRSQNGINAASGNILVSNGTVNGKVLSGSVLRANKGQIQIKNSNVSLESTIYGIYADKDILISGSSVEVSVSASFAIRGQNIVVENSTLIADAEKTYGSATIYAAKNYTQTGSSVSVDAQCGDVKYGGNAIKSGGTIDISDGTLIVTGRANGALNSKDATKIYSNDGKFVYVDIEAYANAINGSESVLTISGEEYNAAEKTGTYLKVVSLVDHGLRVKTIDMLGGTLDIFALSNAIRAAETITIFNGNVYAEVTQDWVFRGKDVVLLDGKVVAVGNGRAICVEGSYAQTGGSLEIDVKENAFEFGSFLSFSVGSVNVRVTGADGNVFSGNGSVITLTPNVKMSLVAEKGIDIGSRKVNDTGVVYLHDAALGDPDVTCIETSVSSAIVKKGGKYYYYVGTKPKDVGLFKHADGNYYVTKYDGSLIIGTRYYVWKIHESASEIPAGWYWFDSEGRILQGIQPNPEKNNQLYYYVNGKPVEKGLFKEGNDYYYSQFDGSLVVNQKYYAWKLSENCDLPVGHYWFGEDGKMYQGIHSNPEKNNALYYYVNGKPKEVGLFKEGNDYYYSQWDGSLIVNQKYYVWKVSEDCDLPAGHYWFGEDGKMYQGVHPNPEKNNALYYYVNGKPKEVGLFKEGDDYYYSQWDGSLVVDKKYYAWKVSEGCDLSAGHYWFGEDGKLYQGIHPNPEKGNKLYYYRNGKPFEMGLFKEGEDYYYAQYDGSLVVDKKYYAWKISEGCDLPAGHYLFGKDGKLYQGSAASPNSGSYGRFDSSAEHLFLATDILTHGIVIYDLNACNGDFQRLKDDVGIVWEWDPELDPNLKTKGPLVGIDSAKYRYSEYYGRDVIVACSSNGWVGIIDYDACSLIWEYQLRSGPHSVELLPNGDLVVASSFDPGALYYFPLSAGINEPVHSIDSLYCHGVSWDPVNECLWVLEHYGVYAAVIENMGTEYGKIVRLDQFGSRFDEGNNGGHAFSPVIGDPGKYWASSSKKVWQFDTSTGEMSNDYFLDEFLNNADVKGVTSFSDGTVIQAIAGMGNNSQTWSSAGFRIVTRDPASGRVLFETVLFEHRDFYKIQPFTKNYQ